MQESIFIYIILCRVKKAFISFRQINSNDSCARHLFCGHCHMLGHTGDTYPPQRILTDSAVRRQTKALDNRVLVQEKSRDVFVLASYYESPCK